MLKLLYLQYGSLALELREHRSLSSDPIHVKSNWFLFLGSIAYSTDFLLIVVLSLCLLNNKFTHRSDITETLSTHYLGVKEKKLAV